MAETKDNVPHAPEGDTRRDFLLIATGTVAAVGTGLAIWPFIDSMNPAADTRALASATFDLSTVEEGQRIRVIWRGKPVFIHHRTAAEIEAARDVDVNTLPDPETDEARIQKAEWLVMEAACTHLGCIPLGLKVSDVRGEFDGWFCPCHGSHYDTAGRIRKGPAPRNLVVPPYTFVDDTTLRIG